MTSDHLGSALFSIIGAALLLAGCGGAGGEAAWTVQEGDLTLTETLRLTEGPDFYFGEIYDVAVDDEGLVYVADGQARHVKVIAPGGAVRDTIGQPGTGPGEFQTPYRLGLTPGDSLHVMDGRSVSVFAPKEKFVYSFEVQGQAALPRVMMVPPKTSGAYFAYLPFPKQIAQTGARAVVRRVRSDGEVSDTLFAVRPRQVSPEGQPIPFSRLSLFDLGPDGAIYHTWNDSLRVTTYSQSGKKRRVVEIPFDPVPVSTEEQKAALSDYSKEEGAALREHMPDTKPAFDHFLVDDEGRYWFGRPTASPDSTAWWVVMPDERRVVTDTLSSDVRIMTVRDGQAYGRATTEAGAPALVRYEFDLEPATSE